MGTILGTYFFGIAVLAHHLEPVPTENETLLSVMGRAVFGRRYADVPDPADLHVRDLGARRQHGVRGLPAAVVDHRPGRLPAAPAVEPRRPSGVLERHPRPVGRCGSAHRGVRRQDQPADPALRRRRVHRVHPVAGRDGGAPLATTRAPLEGGSRDQRHRRGRHGGGHGHRPRVEVHQGRVDPGGAHSVDRAVLQVDQEPLHAGRRGTRGQHRVPNAAAHAHDRRAGRSGPSRHARRDRVRAVARARPSRRHVGGDGSRRGRGDPEAVGGTPAGHPARDQAVAVPRPHRDRSSSSSTSSTRPTRTTSSP